MDRRRRRILYVAPAAMYLVAFLLLPLLLMVAISFTTRGAYGQTVFKFTTEHYARFVDPLYLSILWRTLVFSLGTTMVCLVLSYPLALFIASRKPSMRDRLLMLLMIPFWSNFLVRTYAWIIILKAEGLANWLLQAVGLTSQPLDLLYNQGAVALGYTYTWLPFMILPLYVSVENLDKRLIEAARDLGARPVSVFLRVILPLTAPGAIAGAILVMVPALGMFVITDLMGGARTILLGNLIQNQFGAARNWQFGSAASCILLLLTLVALYAVSGRKRAAPRPDADQLAEGGAE